MDKKLPLLLSAITAIILSVAGLLWWKGAFLPSWVKWNSTDIAAGEGLDITLRRRGVFVTRNGRDIWRSENGWYVQDALFFDVDRDRENELVLTCWKHGSYGKHRPTWVKRDTIAFSQHVFIFRPDENGLRPVWMSSALDVQIADASFDERNCFVAEAPDGTLTYWSWSGWGLERVK
ncbi:MAG: hypothetical protein IJQ21_02860 [Lachnospiraceae bacterium]|nr:hypothetical protein [Lachnospiraceae bacterium]